jgi:hypothetical protein
MPSEERFELRVPFVKVLIALLVTLVPISIAGFYSMHQGHDSLEKAVGRHFQIMADNTAAGVAQFINDRVVDVGFIAVDPAVVDVAEAGNRAYQGLSDTAIGARIEGIDKSWNTAAAEKTSAALLANRASRMLRRHRELDNRILRITVTDAKGAVVAASHKPLDYYQADEEYWQNIYAHGRGAISVTDVLYDEATKSNYIGIGAPILEEGTNRFLGTVDALVDVSTIFPIVNRVALGPTGRTMLVKEDGTVVSAPHINLAMRMKADEYLAVKEGLNSTLGRSAGYVVAEIRGQGRHVVGFADTGLKQGYPNLGWVVLVAQSASEALAPVRTSERLIAFMSLMGLAMVTMFGAWFAMHRRIAYAHLHEEMPAAPEEKVPADHVRV